MDLNKNRLPERVVKNQFLGVPLGNLKDIGTIVTTNQSKIHTLKGYLSYIVVFVYTLGQFALASVSKETSIVVVYGAIGFCMVSAGVRLFYFLFIKQKEFLQIISYIEDDIRTSMANATPQEQRIIKDYHKYARRLSLVLVGSTYISIFMLLFVHLWQSNFNPITALATNAMPPMVRSEWIQENKPIAVNFINLFNLAVLYVVGKCVPNIHGLLCVMTSFIVMNLRLLSHKLEHFHEYVTEKDVLERNEQAFNLLIKFIERHRNIKRNLDKLQEMSGKFLFFDFIIYSLQLCFMLFQIVGSTDFGMLMFNVNYASTLIGIFALYYYYGNDIIYQSNLISTSIYLSNWHEFDLRFRKTMLQLMISSHKPMRMYAGIMDVNIPNFLAILKAGYSFLTILRQTSN